MIHDAILKIRASFELKTTYLLYNTHLIKIIKLRLFLIKCTAASSPTCTSDSASSVLENTTVSFTCSVIYCGNLNPVISFQDGTGSNITSGVTGNVNHGQNVTYILRTTATRNMGNIRCFTFFQPPLVSANQDSHAPSYTSLTACPLFNVQCKLDLFEVIHINVSHC